MVDFAISTARQIAEQVGCRYVILDAELDKLNFTENMVFERCPEKKAARPALCFLTSAFAKNARFNLPDHSAHRPARVHVWPQLMLGNGG